MTLSPSTPLSLPAAALKAADHAAITHASDLTANDDDEASSSDASESGADDDGPFAAAGEGGSESDSGAFARWRKAAGGSKVLGWLVRDKMRDATSQAARLRWGIVRQHALLLAMRRL